MRRFCERYYNAQVRIWIYLNDPRHSKQAIMFCLGLILLEYGFSEIAFAQQNEGKDHNRVRKAACRLYRLMEGAFGGLIATVAGVGAIVSSAFGGYRMAVGLLVTGLGAFTLRSLLSLFFGSPDCSDAWKQAPPSGRFATGG